MYATYSFHPLILFRVLLVLAQTLFFVAVKIED